MPFKVYSSIWNIQKDRFGMMNYYFKNENLEIELET